MDPDLTAQLAPDITAVGTFQRRGDLSVAPGLTLWLCVCVCLPSAGRPDQRARLRERGDDEDEAGGRAAEAHRTNAERR